MSRLRRDDGERGATLVEFALIAPLFFLMLGSMLDIGLAVLGRSVASNAAREGARVGIIQYVNADVDSPPSAAYAAIRAAAESKLVGLVSPDTSSTPYVKVRCLDGAAPHNQIPCTTASVQIDFDLIEVEVRWTSVAPAGGIFTPDSYVDRARMVITGGIGAGGAGCVGAGGTLDFSPSSVSTDEGDGPGTKTVSLTVTRSSSTCVTTVAYATADGSASAVTDYIAAPAGLLTFLDGETTKSFDVEIVGDTVPEANEAFTVSLSGAVNGTIGAGTATVNILNDDISAVPPTLSYLRMYDVDADGKIDQIKAGFDEDIQASCPSPGAFTFPSNPNGVSLQSLSFTGAREVTLTLNEGSADTSAGAVTAALAAGCIRDVDGNSATFGSTAPEDLAAPVLLTVVDSDTTGTDDGTFQQNDWVDFTFSEPLNPATLASATGNVSVSDPPGGGNDVLQVANVLNGSIDLGHNGYVTQNNRTATFASSTLVLGNGNRTLRVTLVNACSGNGCGNLAQGGPANVTFVFVTTLRGFDNLSISSGPISVRLF